MPKYTPDGDRYYPSPPFLPQNVAQDVSAGEPPAIPYHWLEVGNMLLDAASDDLVDPDQTRRLLKELREVRMAKFRAGVDVLDAAAVGGGGVALTGVGAMEVGEGRGFVTGVVDGLRYDPMGYLFEWSFFSNQRIGSTGKSAHRKNRHGENRWPKTWPTAVMMLLKMMMTKWNSKLLAQYEAYNMPWQYVKHTYAQLSLPTNPHPFKKASICPQLYIEHSAHTSSPTK